MGELRVMVYSILLSLQSLLWVVVVIGLLFYMFGIGFTVAVTSHLEAVDTWTSSERQALLDYFGTLDRSMLSLYMSMSGGNSWDVYYTALEPLPGFYRFLFLVFITLAVFAVVNIVTGVFVENAMQSSVSDRENIVTDELEKKREYL